VSLLGFIAVKNIAITTAAFSTYNVKDQTDFSREEFWKHSICVGIATNVLYDYVKQRIRTKLSRDVLHLSGLLHGIGIIIFEQFFHIKFMVALLVGRKENIPLLRAEEETFGTNHCEVGAWLGEKWNLPEPIVEAIRWQYSPENAKPEYKDLVNIAHTAKFICVLEKLGNFGESLSPFKQPILKELGLTVSDIPIVVDKIKEESKTSEIMMAIMKS
jgi:HD-like signal output (HDOD) protein